MTYTLHFLSEVEEDVVNGYVWYENKSLGLGEEFLRVFYTCAVELPRNSLLYPKVYRDYRRRLFRRFPYAIYFTIKGNQIKNFYLLCPTEVEKRPQRKWTNRLTESLGQFIFFINLH